MSSETTILERGAQPPLSRDPRAMEAIMRRYNQRLFRIARGILGNDSDAEDVVQDTYLQVFLKAEGYRAEGDFGAWIGRIATNLALSRRRALGRRLEREQPCGEAGPEAPAPDWKGSWSGPWDGGAEVTPERAAALAELRRLIEREIDSLTDGYREVFVLRVVEGLDVEETATLLGVSPGTVKTRLHRAHRQIRRALNGRLSAAALRAFPFAGRRCDRVVERVLARVAAERS